MGISSNIHTIKDVLKRKYKLAVFVDGPNILRKDINLSLKEIKGKVNEIGAVKICKVYLNQKAPQKLIEAAINEGYEVITTPSDVDVCMAVDATASIFNPNINIIVLVTRDTDFHFVLKKAKEMGKGTIVIGVKESFSSALKNTSDEIIVMESQKVNELSRDQEDLKNQNEEKDMSITEIPIEDEKIKVIEKEIQKESKKDRVIKNIINTITKIKGRKGKSKKKNKES